MSIEDFGIFLFSKPLLLTLPLPAIINKACAKPVSDGEFGRLDNKTVI
jgi:hypothetical protein